MRIPKGLTVKQLQQHAQASPRQKFLAQMQRLRNSWSKMQWIIAHPQATLAEKQWALDWLVRRGKL